MCIRDRSTLQGGPNGAPMGHVFSPFAGSGASPYAPYSRHPAAQSQYPPPPHHQGSAGGPPPLVRHPAHANHHPPVSGQPPQQHKAPRCVPPAAHMDTQSAGMIPQHCSPPHTGIYWHQRTSDQWSTGLPTGRGKLETVRKMKNWCHQMSDFQAKMHQIWFPLGLCPRPCWGSLQTP